MKVHRLAAAVTAIGICVAAAACTSDGASRTSSTTTEAEAPIAGDQPSDAAEPLVRALGCDRIEATRIAGIDESLECFRDGRYLGRVHTFDPAATRSMTGDASAFATRYPEPEELTGNSPCKEFSPGVVLGDGWAVIVPTEPEAPRVAELTGGRIIPPIEPGPIVSYPPPICQEG